jgi:hypothetical protein
MAEAKASDLGCANALALHLVWLHTDVSICKHTELYLTTSTLHTIHSAYAFLKNAGAQSVQSG